MASNKPAPRSAPPTGNAARPAQPKPGLYTGPRTVDIELTNRCNTVCTFCPRDKTPRQGLMAETTFEQAVQRVCELPSLPQVNLCGLGEPMLHPRCADFVRQMRSHGLPPGLTTNGSRLTRENSEQLVGAGLRRLCVSASGLGEQFEAIHRLSFDKIRDNIAGFIQVAKEKPEPERCEVTIQIVVSAEIRDQLDVMKRYWKDIGVDSFNLIGMSNRGGSLDSSLMGGGSGRHGERARSLMAEHQIDPLCGAPFVFVFVGWNGNYYMCCHDYEKRLPLGTVFDYGIMEINGAKKACLTEGFAVCKTCDLDKTNILTDMLARVERGLAEPRELDELLQKQRTSSQRFPVSQIDFGETKRRVFATLLWEEDNRRCA